MMRLSHDSSESLFFEAIEVYATCLLGISFLVELNPWSSEEPRLAPYLAHQLSDGEIWIAHRGVNPCGLFIRWGGV
jgi:hypothetical protein